MHQRDGMPRWLGDIVLVVHAEDQAGIPSGGGEEGALRSVFEQFAHLRVKGDGVFEMRRIEIGLIQIQQRGGDERVVVQKSWNCCIPIAESAQQHACLSIVHARKNKSRRALRSREVAWFVECPRGFGESGNHQAIPASEDFVVQMRANALRSGLEQLWDGFSELRLHGFFGEVKILRRLFDRVTHVENVFSDELAVRIVMNIALPLHSETKLE